jgi:transcriptional regulator with XRE-family HTH domain
MESLAKKIKIALVKKDMNQKEFCQKSGRDNGNFTKVMQRDKFKVEELEKIANDLGYSLEINFIDNETGEKI